MNPTQGWFESDDDYRNRVAQEADERTIEDSTGSAPSQGWFESDENYRNRITQESNAHRIEDSTGSAPSRAWFEDDESYQDRIAREANERTIEDSTGSAPKQGWFESDNDYGTRIRKVANEQFVENGTGSAPKQGWFEGDYDYRSRIAHEAREVRARDRSQVSPDDSASNSAAFTGSEGSASSGGISSSSDPSGWVFAFLIAVGFIIAAFLFWKTSDPRSAPDATFTGPVPIQSSPETPQSPPVYFFQNTLPGTYNMGKSMSQENSNSRHSPNGSTSSSSGKGIGGANTVDPTVGPNAHDAKPDGNAERDSPVANPPRSQSKLDTVVAPASIATSKSQQQKECIWFNNKYLCE